MVAPVTLFVAIREFHDWLTKSSFDFDWLPRTDTPAQMLPSTEFWRYAAHTRLHSCLSNLDALHDKPQHILTQAFKAAAHHELADTLRSIPAAIVRLQAVSAQQVPAHDPRSDIIVV